MIELLLISDMPLSEVDELIEDFDKNSEEKQTKQIDKRLKKHLTNTKIKRSKNACEIENNSKEIVSPMKTRLKRKMIENEKE